MDLIGNRYAIEKPLGAGGMGTVYKARDTRTGGEVAIKLLHPQFVGKIAYVERFRREAEIATRLDHPNVCAGLDRGEHMGTPYLVMELLRGRSVAELVTEDGCIFDIESALSVLVQAAAGLDAMLALAGVVAHRDLSSANVFVSDDGGVKIADFGIAKLETGNETGTGSFLGNVNYMSPEQINDPKRVDARSDLYSLGVVFFEMLTGTRPFTGSPTEVAGKHLRAQPPIPALSGRHADLSQRVLQRLLSKDPAGRFPNPRSLIEYVTAEMPEIRPVVARRRIRIPWAALVAVLSVVVLIAVVVPRLNSDAAEGPRLAQASETSATPAPPAWTDPGFKLDFLLPEEIHPGQEFEVRVSSLPEDTMVTVTTADPRRSDLLASPEYTLTAGDPAAPESFSGRLRLSASAKSAGLALRVTARYGSYDGNWLITIPVKSDTEVKTYAPARANVAVTVKRNP